MYQRLHNKLGRSHIATYKEGDQIISKYFLPDTLLVSNYHCQSLDEQGQPIKIKLLDLNIDKNQIKHHTEKYEKFILQPGKDPVKRLTIRRGQIFYIDITFSRTFKKEVDDITLIFQFGPKSIISKGSTIVVNLKDDIKPHNWSAGIERSKGHQIRVKILTPPDSIIGNCMLTIDAKLFRKEKVRKEGVKLAESLDRLASHESVLRIVDSNERKVNEKKDKNEAYNVAVNEEQEPPLKTAIYRYFHNEPICLLFNPWLDEDTIYMADEETRHDCVVADYGKIYIGNEKQIEAVTWYFAQYKDVVLQSCLYLLDVANLHHGARSNPINVVRTICNLVTATDDVGVMSASWSGSYHDGTAPTLWLGSYAILTEFFRTKLPVKYGQCWVFAAVATSFCRTLGIPCRCVTNFASAHDCDGINAIDLHWSKGEPIDELNSDTNWSFHVWCEAFMTRPDLPMEYHSGWQAFDPTPQETHDGVSCAGPYSVEALKRGEIYLRFEGQLIFSEIYNNQYHWVLMDNGAWRATVTQNFGGQKTACNVPYNLLQTKVLGSAKNVGKRLITHKPGPIVVEVVEVEVERLSAFDSKFKPKVVKEVKEEKRDISKMTEDEILEILDITDAYKYPPGTAEERSTLLKANTWAIHPGIYDKGEGDVRFCICQSEVLAGDPIDICLRLQNLCTDERIVTVTITLAISFYTGLTKRKVKTETTTIRLCSLEAQSVILKVLGEDYCYWLTDLATFKIYVVATEPVKNQLYCACEDFRLTCPEVQILTHRKEKVDLSFPCILKLSCRMPIDMHDCEWMIESPGLMETTKISQLDLEPYAEVSIRIMMKATAVGIYKILASFKAKELMGCRGEVDIEII